MSKHTPGPWVWADDDLVSKSALRVYQAWMDIPDGTPEKWGNRWIAPPTPIVATDSGHYGPRGADRDLIVAAPDLLAACKEFADAVYDPATRKHCGGVMLDRLARLDAAIAKAEGR
jgi:hypothetical protein